MCIVKKRKEMTKNTNEYRYINNQMRKKIRATEPQGLTQKCIEQKAKHYQFSINKVKEIRGKFNKKTVGRMENNQGRIIVNIENIKSLKDFFHIKERFLDSENHKRPEHPLNEVEHEKWKSSWPR